MKAITKHINNNNFSTTLINFIFQFKCDQKEILSHTILARLMTYSNKFYNTEQSFNKEKLNRYIIGYKVSNQIVNDVYFMNFSLLIPNTGIIKENKLEEQIKFILDSIY